MTQYVAVQFNPWDRRSYTYHNDGEPVAVGDEVQVDTPAEGMKTVTVSIIIDRKPDFPTKPIVGPAPASAATGDDDNPF